MVGERGEKEKKAHPQGCFRHAACSDQHDRMEESRGRGRGKRKRKRKRKEERGKRKEKRGIIYMIYLFFQGTTHTVLDREKPASSPT
jgi:hypothetical protein